MKFNFRCFRAFACTASDRLLAVFFNKYERKNIPLTPPPPPLQPIRTELGLRWQSDIIHYTELVKWLRFCGRSIFDIAINKWLELDLTEISNV